MIPKSPSPVAHARPAEAGKMNERDWPVINRRGFVKAALGASAAGALGKFNAARAAEKSDGAWIDVNVHLSRWPTRRVRGDDTPALVSLLRNQGISQAWAGSLDGLLHKDVSFVNARLADECRRHGRGRLVPFGTINPISPGWEEDLRRCALEFRMPGIRLHPNYHGYKLDATEFAELLGLATELGLIIQIVVEMEDERMMHPLLRVSPVNLAPLPALVRKTPGPRIILLNAMRTLRGQPLRDLLGTGEVFVEIAMLEGIGGVGNLLGQAPVERVLFGSHAPLFYLESARLKLKESPVALEALRAIRYGNAQRLLAKKP